MTRARAIWGVRAIHTSRPPISTNFMERLYASTTTTYRPHRLQHAPQLWRVDTVTVSMYSTPSQGVRSSLTTRSFYPKYWLKMATPTRCMESGTWVTTTPIAPRIEALARLCAMVAEEWVKLPTIGWTTTSMIHISTMASLKSMRDIAQMYSSPRRWISSRKTKKTHSSAISLSTRLMDHTMCLRSIIIFIRIAWSTGSPSTMDCVDSMAW